MTHYNIGDRCQTDVYCAVCFTAANFHTAPPKPPLNLARAAPPEDEYIDLQPPGNAYNQLTKAVEGSEYGQLTTAPPGKACN